MIFAFVLFRRLVQSSCARRSSAALCALIFSSLCHAQPLGPVGPEFFGMVMNRSESRQPWPSLPFGSWRLWDTNTTWSQLEPQRGKWYFAHLDRLVAEAEAHSVKPMLVLAHSPEWASARPSEASAYRPGVVAEPARIEDWENYVQAVASRYKGRIREYEIWNEPSDKSHYSGSVSKLVELTCVAYRVLKGIDVGIRVVSPASSGGGRHIQYLNSFLAGGGSACVDVVAHHFYVYRQGPEAMVPLIREVRAVMKSNGVERLPLWNTETGWWIANSDGRADHPRVTGGGWRKIAVGNELAGVIQRAFLLSRAEGVERLYWYSWTNVYGWGLANSDGSSRPGLQAWLDIYNLMLDKIVQSCVLGDVSVCELLDPVTGRKTPMRWSDASAMQSREGAAQGASSADVVPWKP